MSEVGGESDRRRCGGRTSVRSVAGSTREPSPAKLGSEKPSPELIETAAKPEGKRAGETESDANPAGAGVEAGPIATAAVATAAAADLTSAPSDICSSLKEMEEGKVGGDDDSVGIGGDPSPAAAVVAETAARLMHTQSNKRGDADEIAASICSSDDNSGAIQTTAATRAAAAALIAEHSLSETESDPTGRSGNANGSPSARAIGSSENSWHGQGGVASSPLVGLSFANSPRSALDLTAAGVGAGGSRLSGEIGGGGSVDDHHRLLAAPSPRSVPGGTEGLDMNLHLGLGGMWADGDMGESHSSGELWYSPTPQSSSSAPLTSTGSSSGAASAATAAAAAAVIGGSGGSSSLTATKPSAAAGRGSIFSGVKRLNPFSKKKASGNGRGRGNDEEHVDVERDENEASRLLTPRADVAVVSPVTETGAAAAEETGGADGGAVFGRPTQDQLQAGFGDQHRQSSPQSSDTVLT